MKKGVLVLTALILLCWSGLAFADYYMVNPAGKMTRVEKVGNEFVPLDKKAGTSESEAISFGPGFTDSIYYTTYEAGYYYPNRDSNTIIMTWVTPQYACSLVAVRFDWYSPGYAEMYVWDAPEYENFGSTAEVEDTLLATWTFECDTAGPGNWAGWPTVLYGPVLMGSDEPEDGNTRTVTHELSPHLYVGTNDFYCGYRLLTRTNPAGTPYGGKPWPLSDAAYENGERQIVPCRGWMYRVQYTVGAHCSWVEYGNITGMWDMKFIIDIVANAPPKVTRQDELLSTYETGARTLTCDLFDFGVPSESSGVASASIVYYTIHDGDTSAPATIPMTMTSGTATQGTWSGDIPGQTPVTRVFYKITATDLQGATSETFEKSYYVAAGTPGNWLFAEQGNAYYGGLYDPIGANFNNFDHWTYGTPDASVINFYTPTKGAGQPVMYFTGWDLAWVANAQDAIADALDKGASLILCSQDGPHTFYPETQYDEEVTCSPGEFCYDYLKMVSFIDDFSGDTVVTYYGDPADDISAPFADGILASFVCQYGSGYFWPGGVLEIDPDALGCFYYETGEYGGYRYEDATKNYKVEMFMFHPDYVLSEWCVADEAAQDTLVKRMLKWAGATVGVEEETTPGIYFLSQIKPNPVIKTASISFSIPKAADVSLKVYDATGRMLSTLVNGKLDAGVHTANWDAKDVASGIYFYRLSTDKFTQTRKMVVVH